MRFLASIDAIAFSELGTLCRDAGGKSAHPPNGAFFRQDRGGRSYWYFRGYDRPMDGSPGRQTSKYVGAVGDPAIERLVEEHEARRANYRKRRDLASRLRRSGLPTPQPVEGAIAGVLADVGLFEGGSTLVGSVAYQTYAGLLGVFLKEAGYRTEDMDVARASGLRVHPGAATMDLLGALRGVDLTFQPLFHAAHPGLVAGYKNASEFKVEFLTPMRSERDERGAALVEASGFPGVGAQTLKFLEFLLKDNVTSVILHDAGVVVSVPDPMRYAVHKLMVSCLRKADGPSANKAVKDVQQAEVLMEASTHARITSDLGRIWLEAWHRGPKWRKLLREGSLKLGPTQMDTLARGTVEASIIDGLECPFSEGTHPRRALLGQGKAPVTHPGPATVVTRGRRRKDDVGLG